MGRAIFISYRRDDSEGEAGRLFDDLVRAFGDDSVFMDVAGITPGIDFRKAIDENVATCGVLLAVIGPQWVTATDRSGQRRLDDDNDFVRLETASALARNIPVIPVLVHDAKMPRPDQLPDNLKDLAYRNSVEITHARWNSDVQLLTKALGQYVGSPGGNDTQPVHATVPVQLPAPSARVEGVPVRTGSKTPMMAGIAVAVLLVICIGGYFLFHKPGAPQNTTPQTAVTQAIPAAAAATSGGAAGTLDGSWVRERHGALDTLDRMEITGDKDHLVVHAWGGCPTCDWGTQPATFDGVNATATWNVLPPPGAKATQRVAKVVITPRADQLDVTVTNTFDGTRQNVVGAAFIRGNSGQRAM